MAQTAIFGPFFATMLLTFVVWVYMYVRRIRFITGRNLSGGDLARPGELALYLFVTRQVDATYVTAAWMFVAFRVLHSAVHCTINIVMLRFYLYLVSTLAVWFMLAKATIAHFAR